MARWSRPEPDRLCRAELRVEGPLGTWTARFASVISDEPDGLLWDTQGLLLVRYGFRIYALEARTGDLRWSRDSGTPLVALLGSSRLEHVIAQSEIETVALDGQGAVLWRVGHSDVITSAELMGGRLVLQAWGGGLVTIDPVTGIEGGRVNTGRRLNPVRRARWCHPRVDGSWTDDGSTPQIVDGSRQTGPLLRP